MTWGKIMPFHNQLLHEFTRMVDDPLITFFVFSILIDIASGFTKSWLGKGTQSTKGLNGLIKHLLVLFLVSLIYPFMRAIHFGGYMNTMIVYFVGTYWISIFENFGQMGIDLGPLKDHLLKLRDEYLKGEIHGK